jgi:hypothetical protein
MADLAREDIVVLILFSAIALIVPAVVVSHHFYGVDPLAWLRIDWVAGRNFVGAVVGVMALVVSAFNCYVSTFVPWRYQQQHGSMAGFAHMSGLPIIGSLLVLGAGALLPPVVWLGAFLLVLYVIDGNGFPRLLYSLARYGA